MTEHGLPFPKGYPFGTPILLTAEVVRLVAEDGGGFREQLRSRGYAGNQSGRLFPGLDWPGAAVGTDWEPAPRGYPIAPAAGPRGNPVRLRRLLQERPQRGVVVGITYRQEGILRGGSLAEPNRTIRVLEVALHVRSGRAKLALVHPRDVQTVPVLSPRRVPT